MAFHTLLLHWLTANIFWAGGWAAIGYQLLCVCLALFWAVLGAAWGWVRRRQPRLGGAIGLAFLWTAMELAMARLFSGFGWSALAYSQGVNLFSLCLSSGVDIAAYRLLSFYTTFNTFTYYILRRI